MLSEDKALEKLRKMGGKSIPVDEKAEEEVRKKIEEAREAKGEDWIDVVTSLRERKDRTLGVSA